MNRTPGFRRRLIGALWATAVLSIGIAAAAEAPAELRPPPGNEAALAAYAEGVQIYTSVARTDDPSRYTWQLKAPEARLYNGGGHLIALHYAGPTWEAKHGSKVVGARIAGLPSPDPGAIPWLLLQAVGHEGHGQFSDVTYIQRLNTQGGIAPAAPPLQPGLEARVPYTATYVFYKASE